MTPDPELPPLCLAYHGVADVPLALDRHGLFVRPRDLDKQLRVVRGWGYRYVTFGEQLELVSQRKAGGTCALTFDDGFADNLDTLAPLLDRAGATATVFVVPGLFGRVHPDAPFARCLTPDEVLALGPRIEVGSHTVTHRDLTLLSPTEQLAELRDSRSQLEDVLQRPVDIVAYPFGRADEVTLAAAAEAGYRGACRTSGLGSWSDPLAVPRQDMGNFSTRLGLELKRRGLYEPLTALFVGRALRRGSRVLKSHLRPVADRVRDLPVRPSGRALRS